MIASTRFLLVAVLAVSSHASADVSREDAAKATALFQEGLKLTDAGQVDAACAKFEASLALDPQGGTKLNVADCRERGGRLLEALALFQETADDAALTGKRSRETFARQRITSLSARLVRVTLHLATPDQVSQVKLGSKELAREHWSAVHVLDPGPLVIEVTAPERKPFRLERAVGAGTTLTIEVPALEPLEGPTPPVTDPPPGPAQPSIRVSADPERRTSALIFAGTGVGLVLGSVGVGLHAKSKYDDAAAVTDRPGVDRARREAHVGTAIAITGGVAIAIGVVVYVRGGRDRVTVAPTASSNTAGVAASGRF